MTAPDPPDTPPSGDAARWEIETVRAERDTYVGNTIVHNYGGRAPHDPDDNAPLFTVPFLPNTAFQGRDRELAALHQALNGSDTTPVAITPAALTGMGGIGKTQLAVAYAYRCRPADPTAPYRTLYPGGVAWLNAADSLLTGFAALGTILDPACADQAADRQALAAAVALRRRPRTLLICDNLADPLALTRELVPGLLPATLPGPLLCTTRARSLNAAHFQEVALDMLAPDVALAVLLQARPAVRDPAHPEHAAARAICTMVGGLPLALALAGAFLAAWPEVSLPALQQRLLAEGCISALDAEGCDLPEVQHMGLGAALQTQWAVLTDPDARLLLRVAGQLPEAAVLPLARLGLLAGLALDTAPGHPGPLSRALRRLRALSLVETLAADQIRLHPLVREFAAAQTPAAEQAGFRLECAAHLALAYRDYSILEEALKTRGVDSVEADLRAGVALLPPNATASQGMGPMLRGLLRVIQREAHILRGWDPQADTGLAARQIYTRAVALGQGELANSVRPRLRRPMLALRWQAGRESPNLERILTGALAVVRLTGDGQRAVSASEDCTLRVWDLVTGQVLHILRGHTNAVRAVALTGDGQRAVSASNDGTLRVWNLATGQALHTLAGHTGVVRAVALTGDERRAVSASEDGTLRVWDLATGQALHLLRGHTGVVVAVTLTGDGQRAVSASLDGTLRVWDLATGQTLHTLRGHTGVVWGVALTGDGRRAVSASGDHTLRVWDLAAGQMLYSLRGHTHWVRAVAVTEDGQHAVSASNDGTLRVWDLATGQVLHTLTGHTGLVETVVLTADGQRAVSTSRDETLRVWDLATGQVLHTLAGHTGVAVAVAVTGDGRRAVSVSNDGTLRVWNLATEPARYTLAGHTGVVVAVALAGDGRRAVSASEDGTLRVWDLATGQALHTLRGHGGVVRAVALTGDGQRTVSASDDGTLRVWDLATGQALHTLRGHDGVVRAVAVMGDGRRAVSASDDCTLRVWDLTTGQILHTLRGHDSVVRAVALTGDGQRAVSASNDGTLRVWDLVTGQMLHTLRAHSRAVRVMVLAGDRQRAISASEEGTLEVWDLATGQALHTLRSRNRVIELTGDGQCAVAASDFGLMEIWNLAAGQMLHTLRGHTAWVGVVALTGDRQHAVSASEDDTLRMWDLTTGQAQMVLHHDHAFTTMAFSADNRLLLAGDMAGQVACFDYLP